MAKHTVAALYGLIILFGILSYIVTAPFLSYMITGVLLAFIFYPLFKWFSKRTSPNKAAIWILVITLILIVLPSIYFGGEIIRQAGNAYAALEGQGISIFDETAISAKINEWTGMNVEEQIVQLFDEASQTLRDAIPAIAKELGTFLAGIFLMFFVMFYALKEGTVWFEESIGLLPLKRKEKKILGEKLVNGSKALLYGHVMTSLIIGLLIGLLFWFFGVPNVIFWGFVMILLGIIPFLGAIMIYAPAAFFLISQGSWAGGISLFIIALMIQGWVDYILRPKLVSSRSTIHPVFVIVGVIGGIVTMGVVGFLVGPLVLSIFVTLLSFDYKIEKK